MGEPASVASTAASSRSLRVMSLLPDLERRDDPRPASVPAMRCQLGGSPPAARDDHLALQQEAASQGAHPLHLEAQRLAPPALGALRSFFCARGDARCSRPCDGRTSNRSKRRHITAASSWSLTWRLRCSSPILRRAHEHLRAERLQAPRRLVAQAARFRRKPRRGAPGRSAFAATGKTWRPSKRCAGWGALNSSCRTRR